MKKLTKSMIFSFVIVCSFFFLSMKTKANTINKIDMDIYIDNYGNAFVTEMWDTYLYQGTEGYKSYTNLGNKTITNFSVTDDTNREYTYLSYWNTNSSFDNKAYKNGINYTSNGLELCWGISNYGSRIYTLKYTINNFVTKYTDTQGIYFNLLNLDQSVGNVKITIHSDIPFSLDNSRIWAFGYNGTDIFQDGNIVLDSNGTLYSNNYMVILVRFQSDLFNTLTSVNKSFDEDYNSAIVGSDWEDNITSNNYQYYSHSYNIAPYILMIFVIFGLISIAKFFNWLQSLKNSDSSLDRLGFSYLDTKLPKEKDIPYYREIPCDKDLKRAYWILLQFDIVPEKSLKQNLIGALFLKWVKDGNINIIKGKNSLLSKKENYQIDFSNMKDVAETTENKLLRLFYYASFTKKDDKILTKQEFASWSSRHYYAIMGWFSDLSYNTRKTLEHQGLITTSFVKDTNKIKTTYISKRTITPELKEDAIRLIGLKKYLLDFSTMEKREYFDVHLWEEYLIFAELLGIADKVRKQLSIVYPQFNEMSNFNMDITTTISDMSRTCYNNASYSQARANNMMSSGGSYSGSDSRSGGGGSSSSGGGSSSGGSSGGGFR